jgi:hypothetical protein
MMRVAGKFSQNIASGAARGVQILVDGSFGKHDAVRITPKMPYR